MADGNDSNSHQSNETILQRLKGVSSFENYALPRVAGIVTTYIALPLSLNLLPPANQHVNIKDLETRRATLYETLTYQADANGNRNGVPEPEEIRKVLDALHDIGFEIGSLDELKNLPEHKVEQLEKTVKSGH